MAASGRARIGSRLPPAVVVFVGNVVARGLGFLFPVVLAHLMDRPDFAIAAFLINTGFFAGEIVLTGFPTAMTRALASSREARSQRGWILAAILGGIPLLVVSVVLGAALAVRGEAPVALLTVVIVGLTIDAYYFALLRGLRRFGWLAIYRVAANLAQLVVIVVLGIVWGQLPLGVAVAVYSLIYLAPIAVIEVVDGPARHALRPNVSASISSAAEMARVIDLTRFAIPALLSGAAYGAIMGFDVFFVRIFAPDALADYAAARSLAVPMLMVPFALSVVLLPQVAAAPPDETGRLLRRALGIAIGTAVLGWLAYLVLGPAIIALIFPPSYAGATAPLTTLVPAIAIVGVYSIMSGWMLGIGRPWTTALCLAVGATVTIVGQVLITSRYGAVGAGIAMALGAATALVLVSIMAFRILREGPAAPTPMGVD